MKCRPILFSGPMVRALLAGRKTQTRRLVKRRHYTDAFAARCPAIGVEAALRELSADPALRFGPTSEVRSPYGVPGDRLWVREALRRRSKNDGGSNNVHYETTEWAYAADGSRVDMPTVWPTSFRVHRTRSPIHMPRWASRITLELTDVRLERLKDITAEDAIAEGLAKITKDDGRTWKYGIADRDGLPGTDDDGWPWKEWEVDPRAAYAKLWDALHPVTKKAPYDLWIHNPWVWALTFSPIAEKRCG